MDVSKTWLFKFSDCIKSYEKKETYIYGDLE